MVTLVVAGAGVAAVTVTAEVDNVDRSPESVTVQPGDTVSVSVTVEAADTVDGINASAEELQSGSSSLTLTNANADEGSAAANDEGDAIDVIYAQPANSDTLTYDIEVASDASPGTYTIDGTVVTNESFDSGATTVTVEDDTSTPTETATPTPEPSSFSVERSPDDPVVEQGGSVDVQVDLTAGENGINTTSEEFQGGSSFLAFTGVNSQEGSANVDNDDGSISVIYAQPANSDTLTYTVDVASDATPGTYTIDGTAVTNQERDAGTTTITIEEDDESGDGQFSVDRSPESTTVEQGETVGLTVDLTAGSNGLNASDEDLQSGADFLDFSNVNSQEGSASVDNDDGAVSVIYAQPADSDTLTYEVDVAEDADPGTYTIDGSTVTDQERDAGTTTITVEEAVLSTERSPESETVAPGESVDVTVELTAGSDSLNTTSEELQSGSEFLNFSNVNSQEGSANVDNDGGAVDVIYAQPADSDTLTYTVEVDEDADTGTYDIDGSAVTDKGVDTGTTSIVVQESDADDGDGFIGSGSDEDDDGSGFVPADDEANISVISADSPAGTVSVGDEIEITATFENDGDTSGAVDAKLQSDGQVIASKEITVGANSTREVSFTIEATDSGEFELTVNGFSAGTVTIEPDDTPTPTTPDPTNTPTSTTPDPTDTPTPTDGDGPGFGVISVILAIGAALLLARRR